MNTSPPQLFNPTFRQLAQEEDIDENGRVLEVDVFQDKRVEPPEGYRTAGTSHLKPPPVERMEEEVGTREDMNEHAEHIVKVKVMNVDGIQHRLANDGRDERGREVRAY
ncbi:hypothetical protein PM082_003709 [Marasmius tenuissimus]|nr:hypothetical protein PM082_003709 [Marasmius tenuissimus]